MSTRLNRFEMPRFVQKDEKTATPTYALFTADPDASEDKIRSAVSRHFCRCTGYEAIWNGALLAQKYLREEAAK